MQQADYSTKKFLIVDDQKPFLIMLKGIILGLGAKDVKTVQSGEAAISACRKEKYDLVIADLHLGAYKKNGYQFLEEIRVRNLVKPETVFIMVSGDSHRPMVLGSIERSPDDYIIKPFSQAQLNNRLNKAFIKRQALKPIYQEISKENYPGAIDLCKQEIEKASRYRQNCSFLLTELYWRTEKYNDAKSLVTKILEKKPVPWAQVALARTEFFLGNYDEAITLARKVIAGRLLILEGQDILAHCHLALKNAEDALIAIKKSLDLSPFSMERQFMGASIGRACGDYEFAKTCCKELFEQSKRSVYRNLSHMCNFVRSILDAAEKAEEKSKKNRYQQEAMITLQRLRHDELVTRNADIFDYDAYENIVVARVNALDGKAMDAKRSMVKAQKSIEEKFDEFPLVFAPDSIKVLSELGEFKEAKELAEKMRNSDINIDSNAQFVLDNLEEIADEQLNQFEIHNNEGLDCFNRGKYQAALNAFIEALTYSPVNTSVALYILHSLNHLVSQAQKPGLTLLIDCKKYCKFAEGLPLNDAQTLEFQKIKTDLNKYMDL